MKFVVYSNIVFSGILNPYSKIAQILMHGYKVLEFYTIKQLTDEIFDHKDKIISISKLDFSDFEFLFNMITKRIEYVDEIIIPAEIMETCLRIVAPIDKDDLGFVALAMFLDCKLWTGDKKLINGLRSKGIDLTVTTAELVNISEDLDNFNSSIN